MVLFDLPRDLQPGGQLDLSVEFGASWPLDQSTGSAITSFLSPRLWWGFGTLDDYDSRHRTAIRSRRADVTIRKEGHTRPRAFVFSACLLGRAMRAKRPKPVMCAFAPCSPKRAGPVPNCC